MEFFLLFVSIFLRALTCTLQLLISFFSFFLSLFFSLHKMDTWLDICPFLNNILVLVYELFLVLFTTFCQSILLALF